MREGPARLAAGLGALALLWIVVYWWWPSEPPVTFAQPDPPAAPTPQPKPSTPPDDEPTTSSPPPPVASSPPPPSAVIPPQFIEHTVADGETLASISKHYFGTESRADAISRANPLANLNPLRVGRVIRIPKDPENVQGLPTDPQTPASLDATGEYVVKKGDSLSKIAAEVYGDSGLSDLIYRANRDQMPDEHTVRIGQRLRIPPKPK